MGGAVNPRDGMVECTQYGSHPATFVCRHIVESLRTDLRVRFFWAADPDSPRPDAWCEAHEAKVESTGGEWTAESEAFTGVMLRCGGCFDRAKALWQSVRP